MPRNRRGRVRHPEYEAPREMGENTAHYNNNVEDSTINNRRQRRERNPDVPVDSLLNDEFSVQMEDQAVVQNTMHMRDEAAANHERERQVEQRILEQQQPSYHRRRAGRQRQHRHDNMSHRAMGPVSSGPGIAENSFISFGTLDSISMDFSNQQPQPSRVDYGGEGMNSLLMATTRGGPGGGGGFDVNDRSASASGSRFPMFH